MPLIFVDFRPGPLEQVNKYIETSMYDSDLHGTALRAWSHAYVPVKFYLHRLPILVVLYIGQYHRYRSRGHPPRALGPLLQQSRRGRC